MTRCTQCMLHPATAKLTSLFDPHTIVAHLCAACNLRDRAALHARHRNEVDHTRMPAQVVRYRARPTCLAVACRDGALSSGWNAETGHGRLSAMSAPVTLIGADVYISLRRRHSSYLAFNRVRLTELKRTNPGIAPAYDLTGLADINGATRARWARAFSRARCLPVASIVAVKCAGARLVLAGALPAELWALVEREWWSGFR